MTRPFLVTITGADNAVDHSALLELSKRYPFVEWGILCSIKWTETTRPRYPTGDWLVELQRVTTFERRMRLSAHFCGDMSRRTLEGYDNYAMGPLFKTFARLQLNGYSPPASSLLRVLAAYLPFEFIFQCRSLDDLRLAEQDVKCSDKMNGNVSLLYDPSGGRGVEVHEWPSTTSGLRLGFAGGIGPDTVEDVIRIARLVGASWVDMESGVRTDDKFDLEKVRTVLERAERALQ